MMSYYNTNTQAKHSTLPRLPDVLNPSWDDYYRRGWREVVPFAVPDGMVIVPGTRRIEMAGDEARDVCDVITQDQANAQAAADFADLCRKYGGQVMLLQSLLEQIGMSIPTDADLVQARVLDLVASGNQEAGVIGLMVKEVYAILGPVQGRTDEILEAVRGAA